VCVCASRNHVEGNLIKIKAITLLAVPPPVNNAKSDEAFGELILLILPSAQICSARGLYFI
jgi:hypothetical protein